MAKLSISPRELERCLYNSLLFCREKTFFGNVVRITSSYEDLRFLTSDDHIILSEKINDVTFINGSRGSSTQYFDRKAVREMVDSLKGVADDEILLPDWTEEFPQTPLDNPEVLGIAQEVLNEGISVKSRLSGAWALNRDRLRNLGLLKTPGSETYPIDLLYADSAALDGRPVVHFRVGPTVRGAIAPMLRGNLPEHVVRDGLIG